MTRFQQQHTIAAPSDAGRRGLLLGVAALGAGGLMQAHSAPMA